MNKIAIIIQREYTTRVRKKSFIIMTLLAPFLIAALIITPMWLGSIKDSGTKHIAVIDHTGKYAAAFEPRETYQFDIVDRPLADIRESKSYYALIFIQDDLASKPDAVTIYAGNQVGLEFKSYISGLLSSFIENEKLSQYNIPDLKQILEESKTHLNIKTVKWSDDGSETETSSELAMIIGMCAALLIYVFVLVYGSLLMRGIVEEKTNRIIEIIISSVKPFELMMGKTIGIALVGLTQFVIWVVLLMGILLVFGSQTAINMPAPQPDITDPSTNFMIPALLHYNFWEIGFFFVLFFIGGYLLYASLFAAIGAAADSETDTQQFMIPITIPVIFALYAAIYSANNPDGPLAFWTSIIPFTSPIVMMVRIPLGVPSWQLILSVSVLFLSFAGTTWIAAKIYRTGILMYGKKVSYKEIWKWIKYK